MLLIYNPTLTTHSCQSAHLLCVNTLKGMFFSFYSILTAAFFPGKLKKESGPFLWAMYFRTDKSFTAWRGWGKNTKTHKDHFGQLAVLMSKQAYICTQKHMHMNPCYTLRDHSCSHKWLKARTTLVLLVLHISLPLRLIRLWHPERFAQQHTVDSVSSFI